MRATLECPPAPAQLFKCTARLGAQTLSLQSISQAFPRDPPRSRDKVGDRPSKAQGGVGVLVSNFLVPPPLIRPKPTHYSLWERWADTHVSPPQKGSLPNSTNPGASLLHPACGVALGSR